MMIEYNVEKKKVEEAIQQVYRDFALKYGEIQKSELSEVEKLEQIDYLLEVAISKDEILRNTRSLSELSSQDKEDLEIKEESETKKVDTNVIDTLVSVYAKRAKIPSNRINGMGILDGITLRGEEELEEIDTSAFEEELRQYFTEHYFDLLSNGYNNFLSDVTEVSDNTSSKNGELIEMAIKHGLDPKKFNCFGYQLTVQDGLVAEEDSILGSSNIFYASPEAINKRIYDLYSETLFQEQKSNGKDFFLNDGRKLKNVYITYAEKNEIEIQDKDVLEELPIDMNKVQGIATYINRVLNENGTISNDMTEEFTDEIQKDYSKIMNLTSFNFGELETVKRVSNDSYMSLYLNINDDNIIKKDEFSPDIAYGTPEYLKGEYQRVMSEIARLSHTDAFKEGDFFDVEEVNKQKEALRRYITENGIEGIDISIPEVKIDHQRTEMIANAILSKYGGKYEDKEGMKAKILKKIEDRYPEMFYERQVIGLNDLVGEELKEMGKSFVDERLYMQKDFVYIGDHMGFDTQCLYATPEALLDKIAALDEKISTSDFSSDEKRIRETLANYAKDNKFKIEIPDVKSVEQRRKQEQDIFSFKGSELTFFDRDMLPDDPTARPKIELEDTMFDAIYKISEGVPGAMVGITKLMESDEAGFMLLLGLDDMNIRGSQVWEAYKYLYNEDAKKFAKAVKNRDKNMVDFINQEMASVGGEKAVTGGASFDRNKNPNKYRFTELEVEQLKTQKQERIEKQRKAREKMIANSPVKKKSLGQKKREERDAKRKAYRERLIAMGKKSIGDLDEELTDLQAKEQQAKELCEQYEEQLSEKNGQEL
ncbi:MAG: hypothetical protein V8S04_02705 [Clostridia bacterium]|jgi:hypothetical protein